MNVKTKHKCEYVGCTGRRQCPRPGIIPLRINGHPWIYYCPAHAKEIREFLTDKKYATNQQANKATREQRHTQTQKRRQRLHQLIKMKQPINTGALTAYAKALATTPRTIRKDLTHLTKNELIKSEYYNHNGRTRVWRTIKKTR